MLKTLIFNTIIMMKKYTKQYYPYFKNFCFFFFASAIFNTLKNGQGMFIKIHNQFISLIKAQHNLNKKKKEFVIFLIEQKLMYSRESRYIKKKFQSSPMNKLF